MYDLVGQQSFRVACYFIIVNLYQRQLYKTLLASNHTPIKERTENTQKY